MSQGAKITLWVVIVVIIVGGIWWWMTSQNAVAPTSQPNAPTSANGTQPTQQTAGNGAPAGANGVTSVNDTSNAALNQDLSNIGTQSNGFNSDDASINQGLNDQPVQQSQL